MKRATSVTLAILLVLGLAGLAFAYGPRGAMMGMGPQMMGPGWQGGPMGSGGMGGGAGCPGMAGTPGAAETPQAAITEEKAKELAATYTDKYFKGFTVERVLPFAGRMGTAYQVELKGPKGEQRVLHVNPWGGVRPFGPLAATE
jgi:hypothetical protein